MNEHESSVLHSSECPALKGESEDEIDMVPLLQIFTAYLAVHDYDSTGKTEDALC